MTSPPWCHAWRHWSRVLFCRVQSPPATATCRRAACWGRFLIFSFLLGKLVSSGQVNWANIRTRNWRPTLVTSRSFHAIWKSECLFFIAATWPPLEFGERFSVELVQFSGPEITMKCCARPCLILRRLGVENLIWGERTSSAEFHRTSCTPPRSPLKFLKRDGWHCVDVTAGWRPGLPASRELGLGAGAADEDGLWWVPQPRPPPLWYATHLRTADAERQVSGREI